MKVLELDLGKCIRCGGCASVCPFGAINVVRGGVEINENCRLCGLCVKECPVSALELKVELSEIDKSQWKGILVFAELEEDRIHPVTYELIGEANRLGEVVGFDTYVLMIGGKGASKYAEALLDYQVKEVFVYEHEALEGFKADSYANVAASCISKLMPSVVLIGGTELGRSLAPRLSTKYETGLTADCTKLAMKENTDLVQIRPAFGGNIMAQIVIEDARPQFATVRYRVMEKAKKRAPGMSAGRVSICQVKEEDTKSGVEVISREVIKRQKSIEEEDVLVVAGRGADKCVPKLKDLAELLGGGLAFTRPMVEAGYGDPAHQIGLSGRTVKPKLILTFGVSGAIQFTACMNASDCIVAVNNDPEATIFQIANYCVQEDLYEFLPGFIDEIKAGREA